MKKRARIIVPILVIIIALFFVILRNNENPDIISISGNIEATDSMLSFNVPGKLLERLVDEGEAVSAGQPIARLDSIDYELLVSQAEANLSLAKAALADLRAGSRSQEIDRAYGQLQQARAVLKEVESGSRSQEIAAAEAQLSQANAALDAAASQLELAKSEKRRYSGLYDSGVISKSEYDRIRTQFDTASSAYDQAEALVESASEALSLRREGATGDQIDQARAAVNQAEAAYSLVKEGPRAETIEQAQARVDIADESLKQAKQRLEYTELLAPFDGIILSKSAEPGEYLNPGAPVVTIGALDKVWLRAYINETDLSRLSLGQAVDVTTDSYPGKKYAGRISFISSEAEFTPKAVQTSEERVKLMYLVKIELDNPAYELKPGMPADCVINVGK